MGADISMFAEVKKSSSWEPAEPVEQAAGWPGDIPSDLNPSLKPKVLYDTRNYSLFAILANVRNAMRVVTPFEYISEPRGLPADLSQPLREWHAHWDGEAFGESWLLLEELTTFDWHGKSIVRRGFVDPKAAHLFHNVRRGFPYGEWPEGLMIAVADQGTGVEVNWIETYAEAAGSEFMDDTLDKLRSYGPGKDVRVVFWFDQ